MGELIGYARCSTVLHDLTAQRQALTALGVAEHRIYLDQGLTGSNRARPGLNQALAAVHAHDTLVVPKLTRSVPDAGDIGDTTIAALMTVFAAGRATIRRVLDPGGGGMPGSTDTAGGGE